MRGRRGGRGRLVTAVVVLGLAVGAQLAAPPPRAAAQQAAAPGGPGALAYFDLARKDCLGTARNDTSRIWYTVADGVLSDVYSPTIDNTNVKSLQFVVTDGSTFTDLQTRDTTYSVRSLDRSGMVCEVTSTDPDGALPELSTTFVTDPQRDSVVLQVRLRDDRPGGRNNPPLALYAHLDPTINGNGGGGGGNGGADNAAVVATTDGPVPVAYDLVTQTSAANRDYGVPLYAALRANRPFLTRIGLGYLGSASDGLAALDTSDTCCRPLTTAPLTATW